MWKKTAIRRLIKRLPVSAEDVRRIMADDEPHELKDVTPSATSAPERRPNLAQQIAAAAITGEVMPDQIDQTEQPHWTEGVAWDEAFPGSDEFTAGAAAFASGQPVTSCPHEGDMAKAVDWIGGYHGAARAQE